MAKHTPASQGGIGIALFLILCASILPVAVVTNGIVTMPFVIAVGAGYLLQIAIFLLMALHWRIQPRGPWLGIALFCGFTQLLTLISTTFNYNDIALMDLANAVSKVIGIVFYAGLVGALSPTEKDIRQFLTGVLGLAAIAILVNAVMNGADFTKILSVSSSYSLDFSSFFANRNQFGSFLFLSIVAHCLYIHKKKINWFNVLLFSGQVISLVLTMSRGAILALAVFIFVFCLAEFARRPKYLLLLVTGALTTVLIGSKLGLGETINRLLLRPDAGLSTRDVLWAVGVDVWTDSSVLLGVGSFSGLELARMHEMELEEFHSFWVEALVSGGLVELFLILLVLGIVWRQLSQSSLERYPRRVLFSAAVGVFVLSLVESLSFFTIGLVGSMYSLFLISVPLLYARLNCAEAPRTTEIENQILVSEKH